MTDLFKCKKGGQTCCAPKSRIHEVQSMMIRNESAPLFVNPQQTQHQVPQYMPNNYVNNQNYMHNYPNNYYPPNNNYQNPPHIYSPNNYAPAPPQPPQLQPQQPLNNYPNNYPANYAPNPITGGIPPTYTTPGN